MPTLNWIGKQAVVTHHKDVPYRLEPVAELSCAVRAEPVEASPSTSSGRTEEYAGRCLFVMLRDRDWSPLDKLLN